MSEEEETFSAGVSELASKFEMLQKRNSEDQPITAFKKIGSSPSYNPSYPTFKVTKHSIGVKSSNTSVPSANIESNIQPSVRRLSQMFDSTATVHQSPSSGPKWRIDSAISPSRMTSLSTKSEVNLPVSPSPNTTNSTTSKPLKPPKPAHLSVLPKPTHQPFTLPPTVPAPSPASLTKIQSPQSRVEQPQDYSPEPVSPAFSSGDRDSDATYAWVNAERLETVDEHKIDGTEISDESEYYIESKDSKRENMRILRLQELVTTEKTFHKDMLLLSDIFMNTSPLSPTDNKSLFANLPAIIELSENLHKYFETAVDDGASVGKIFLKMMPEIESVYAEYCKHHQAAITLLAHFVSSDCSASTKAWLSNCQMQLVGRTQAWDLQSMVIKPVQRVLKYPLLIKDVLKDTEPSHFDFDNLTAAYAEIER
ncbi:hypothetical protein HK096_008015, partial [Nowakowskiella sp. JEL0078]